MLGTVPAGSADISDLCEIFVCFDDLRLPWGQSPQVSQYAARMAGLPGGGGRAGRLAPPRGRDGARPSPASRSSLPPPQRRRPRPPTGSAFSPHEGFGFPSRRAGVLFISHRDAEAPWRECCLGFLQLRLRSWGEVVACFFLRVQHKTWRLWYNCVRFEHNEGYVV